MTNISLFVAAFMVAGVLLFAILAPLCWKRRSYAGSMLCVLMALVLVLSAATVGFITLGTRGYQALTREELAATIHIKPLGNQQFQATIKRPKARDTVFAIAGDEIYLDARILKWKPIANILGLHTAYRLDRISGRYMSVEDEQTKVRTLYSLSGPMRPWDLFSLRRRFEVLAPVLDASYGSGTFVTVRDATVLRVLVSTSGLLIRRE